MKLRQAFLIGISWMAVTQAAAANPPMPATKPVIEQDIERKSSETITGISIYDAIRYAIETSPEVVASLQSVALAEENIDLARAGYRPNISADASIIHSEFDNDTQNGWDSNTSKNIGVSLTQPLYRGGQTTANLAEQKALKDASEFVFSSDVQDKIVETVMAYMGAYEALETVGVNENNQKRLRERLRATKAGYEVGELTRTDVAQAEARLSDAEADLIRSRSILDVAKSELYRVTGIKDLDGLVYPSLDYDALPETLDDALLDAEEKNPTLLAARERLKAQGYNIEEQEGAFLPEVALLASLDADRTPSVTIDRQESASVGITATLPLYQSGVIRNQLRQAKILERQQKANFESTERNVRNRVIAAWGNYKASDAQIEARQAQLKAARIAQDGVSLEQTVGARSILDVLDANQDVRDAELALVQAKSQAVQSYYELLASMGRFDSSLWDNLKTRL